MEKTFLIILFIISRWCSSDVYVGCVFSELACQSTETYVKVRKQCGLQHASEEKYQFILGNEVVATSPVFVNNELRESEFCLPSSTHSVYTLRLFDTLLLDCFLTSSYGDGWDSKSWVEVQGPYSNVVFKNYLHSVSSEEYTISRTFLLLSILLVYNPVPKNAIWKVITGSVPVEWKEPSYDISSWQSFQLGNESETESGNQFYRFTFDSDASMAVYELALQYRYGIAAHINGVEVFRDNLGSGAILPSSLPLGNYDTYEYHHIIRQLLPTFTSQSTLAVEVHLPSSTSEQLRFNGWLSLYHATLLNSSRRASSSLR